MQPKILTAAQLTERNDKIAHEVFRAILAETKLSCRYVELVETTSDNNEYRITVLCPEPDSLVQLAETIVNKKDRCILVDKGTIKGKFDWASDTYIKPAFSIIFKVV